MEAPPGSEVALFIVTTLLRRSVHREGNKGVPHTGTFGRVDKSADVRWVDRDLDRS
jgi:hypothetical protein